MITESNVNYAPQGLLNIVGSLKIIKKNKHPFGVIKELLSNAIEACLIKKDEFGLDEGISINIKTNCNENNNLIGIEITDNGIGFNPKQWESFCCLGTTNKSRFKCKGAGRIQFWHYFNDVKISTIYIDTLDNTYKNFVVQINSNQERVCFDTVKSLITNSTNQQSGTTITLSNPKIDISYDNFYTSSIFEGIQQSLLLKLLHLKDTQIAFKITINDDNEYTIDSDKLPEAIIENKEIKIPLRRLSDGLPSDEKVYFFISAYKTSIQTSHAVQLCVKDIAVENIVTEFIDKSLLKQKTETGSFEFIFIKENIKDQKTDGVLEEKLNTQTRDSFDNFYINYEEWKEKNEINLLSNIEKDIFRDDIITEIDSIIASESLFKFNKKTKPQIENELGKTYLIPTTLIKETNVRIKYGEEVSSVAKRVYRNLSDDRIKNKLEEQKVIEDVESIINSVLNDVEDINTKKPDWREELKKDCEKLAKITSEDRKLELTEHAYLRIKKENLLAKFIEIEIKANQEYKIDQTESLIHNILFPQAKNSNTANEGDNDLWMINEDYGYYNVISHESLASYICPKTNKKLLSNDFESSFSDNPILKEHFSNGRKPDLAVFYDNESIVIIELKKPNEKLSEGINQVITYAQIIASKMNKNENSKIPYDKFYLYVIGSKNMLLTAGNPYISRPLADGEGFFAPGEKLMDLEAKNDTGATYYLEICSYERIVNQLSIRNKRYRKILGVNN